MKIEKNSSANLRVTSLLQQDAFFKGDDPLAYMFLELELDKNAQTVSFQTPVNKIPADIFLVLDVSGSMNAPDRYPLLRLALQEFLSRIEPEDRLGISIFSTDAEVITPLIFGKDARESTHLLLERMDRSPFKFGGGTYLAPGLRQAHEILGAQDKNRARRVYILTDGELHDTSICQKTLIDFRPISIEVHSYGFGSAFNPSSLKNLLSDQLGGSVKPICNKKDIVKTFAHIAEVNRRILGQNGTLRLEFSQEIDCGDIWVFRPQERYFGKIQNRCFVREIGALEAKRSYSFLIETRLSPSKTEKSPIAKATLSWKEGSLEKKATFSLEAKRVSETSDHIFQKNPQVEEAFQILDSLRKEGDKDAEIVSIKARLEIAKREQRDPGLLDALQTRLDILEGRMEESELSDEDQLYLKADLTTAASPISKEYLEVVRQKTKQNT